MNNSLQHIAENPEVSLAVPAAALKAQTTADMAGQLVQVLGSLGLVIGLVFLLAYLVKRNQNFSTSTKQLKVVERLVLNSKDQLLLVSVNGQQVLLGASAAGLSTLLTFDAEHHAADASACSEAVFEPEPSKQKASNFAVHLQQILATRMAS